MCLNTQKTQLTWLNKMIIDTVWPHHQVRYVMAVITTCGNSTASYSCSHLTPPRLSSMCSQAAGLDYCNSLLYYMIYITDQHLKHCSWCRTLSLGWWLLSANGPYHPSLAFSLLTPSLPTYCLQAGNATGCLNQNELENLADFTYSAILCCHTILTNLHFQDEHNIQCRLTTLQTMRNSLMVRDTTPWHSAC